MKLHVGPMADWKEGVIHLNSSIDQNPDIVWDLGTFPWPIQRNTCEAVCITLDPDSRSSARLILNEIHRIARPGAVVELPTANPFIDAVSNTRWFEPMFNVLAPIHPDTTRFRTTTIEMRIELGTRSRPIQAQPASGRQDSSPDPRVGLRWQPAPRLGIRLRVLKEIAVMSTCWNAGARYGS